MLIHSFSLMNSDLRTDHEMTYRVCLLEVEDSMRIWEWEKKNREMNDQKRFVSLSRLVGLVGRVIPTDLTRKPGDKMKERSQKKEGLRRVSKDENQIDLEKVEELNLWHE